MKYHVGCIPRLKPWVLALKFYNVSTAESGGEGDSPSSHESVERRIHEQQRQADESSTESAVRTANLEEVSRQGTGDASMSSNTPSGDDSNSNQNTTDAVSDVGQRLS